MRGKTEANEIKLKLQAIKDKIAEHDDSLFPVNTCKLRTELSSHHNFNSDKSHEIKSDIERDVAHFIEDLEGVSAKYWATYKIGLPLLTVIAQSLKSQYRQELIYNKVCTDVLYSNITCC